MVKQCQSAVLCFIVCCLALARSNAGDWPQYRGPKRDDVSTEKGLLTTWSKGGPTLAWTFKNAGIGYSGPAIVGTTLYTIGGRQENDVLIAVDTQTGQERWAITLGQVFEWKGNNWSAGPSATPTVDGDLVYAVSGYGDLVCATTKGEVRWRVNMPKDLDAQVNPIGGGPKNVGWGFTASPLIDGNNLICVPGGPKGTLAALDKKTGLVRWRSLELTDQAAYTSPVLVTINDVKQYIVLTNKGLSGIATDGKLLWRAPRAPAYGTEVVNTPLVAGNTLHTTVGAGAGCELVKVIKDGAVFKSEVVYSNKNLANHHGNTILVGEHIYGHSQGRGWVCQNINDGTLTWEQRNVFPPAAIIYAEGRLYCVSENDGTTALVDVSPKGWTEISRFALPQQSKLRKPAGKVWTPPVIAHGKLYLRDQELLYCYDIQAK